MLPLIKIVINYFSLISFFLQFPLSILISPYRNYSSSCAHHVKICKTYISYYVTPSKCNQSCIFLVNAIKYKASYGIMQNLLPWFFSYFLLAPKNCKHGYVFIGLWKVSFLNFLF